MGTPPGNYDSLDALPDDAPAPAPVVQPAPAPFQSQTLPPIFSFNPTGGIGINQAGYYVTLDDTVELNVWNSNVNLTSLVMQVRTLKPDGTFVMNAFEIDNVHAQRNKQTKRFGQLEGFIVSVAVGPPGVDINRGETFVNVNIARGVPGAPLVMAALVADYVTSAFIPRWPDGQVRSCVDGAGNATSVISAVPLPSQNVTITQPANTRWRVQSVSFTMATDNTAITRVVALAIITPTGTIYQASSISPQPQSTVFAYTFAPGAQWQNSAVEKQLMTLPDNLLVNDGTQFLAGFFGTSGVNDQMSAVTIQVEEWIEQ